MSSNKKFADGRQSARLENYSANWKSDSAKDTTHDQDKRNDNYDDVVNGYYDGATQLYEYGWGTSFHFSRYYKGEGFYQALARHEHYLASMMNLKPGMRVLDVGCGVGGPAREIANFMGVTVVGINNNEYQIGKARNYTKKMGLQDRVTFHKGDFMKLAEQFGEESFDAVYAIEATVHAPSFEGVYGEIKRVLKPGGVFGVYEWVMTNSWDPSIPSHKKIAHGIEIGNGIPEMRSMHVAKSAILKVGFSLEHEQDLAAPNDEVKWYYPLEGDFSKAQTWWDVFHCWVTSRGGQLVTHTALRALELVGVVPKGTWDVGEQLRVAGDALVAGGKENLFTPMYLMICRKPVA